MATNKLVKFDIKDKTTDGTIDFIVEMFKQYDLNDNTSIQFEECIIKLRTSIKEEKIKSNYWDIVENNLTSKQLLKVLKGSEK